MICFVSAFEKEKMQWRGIFYELRTPTITVILLSNTYVAD